MAVLCSEAGHSFPACGGSQYETDPTAVTGTLARIARTQSGQRPAFRMEGGAVATEHRRRAGDVCRHQHRSDPARHRSRRTRDRARDRDDPARRERHAHADAEGRDLRGLLPRGRGLAQEARHGSAAMSEAPPAAAVQPIRVTSGGPVIQILPGPFPFPDSAAPILRAFGDEREGLESQVKNGPYSNNVAAISGTFSFTAWDKGATRDSVDGIAEFGTQDGAHWKLILDRVQTKDVPHHPRFGGVILGLYYHGVTQVHTPLVPTINSAVALWAFGHLYRNGVAVTGNAMVHVMLLSRTRRDGDFALACWDCSRNKIEELQLQILPGPGEPKFDAPGGFLFVNWERSTSRS